MKYSGMFLGLCILITGCGEHAAKGAGEGATVGAVSGAVGGLVSALVFGGDPADAAARGAVYGGATGATVGAMSGSKIDAKIKEERKARAEEIRARIGDDAFKGLSALVNCDHQDSIYNAAKAQQSKNPNYTVSGYWLEVLTYADQENIDKVESLIPVVAEKDWDINNTSEAKENLVQLQDKLMQIRKEYKLPKRCE